MVYFVGNLNEMVEKEDNFLDGVYTSFVTVPQKRPVEEVNDKVSSKQKKEKTAILRRKGPFIPCEVEASVPPTKPKQTKRKRDVVTVPYNALKLAKEEVSVCTVW